MPNTRRIRVVCLRDHRCRVNGNGKCRDPHFAAIRHRDGCCDGIHRCLALHGQLIRLPNVRTSIARHLPCKRQEIIGVDLQVEPNHIRPEQTPHNLLAPRKLAEQVGRGERNMQEKTDAKIRAGLAQNTGDKLQLVILNPHRRPFSGDFRNFLGEFQIHLAVGFPPVPVILRRHDQIVVERPQRGVGKPLVKLLIIHGGELHWMQQHTIICVKWLWGGICHSGPAHPATTLFSQHRCQRGNQAARAWRPFLRAVRMRG